MNPSFIGSKRRMFKEGSSIVEESKFESASATPMAERKHAWNISKVLLVVGALRDARTAPEDRKKDDEGTEKFVTVRRG